MKASSQHHNAERFLNERKRVSAPKAAAAITAYRIPPFTGTHGGGQQGGPPTGGGGGGGCA